MYQAPGRFQNKILWSFIAKNPKYVQTLLNISHRRFTLIYVLHWKNLNFVWLRFHLSTLNLPITTISWRYFRDPVSQSKNHYPVRDIFGQNETVKKIEALLHLFFQASLLLSCFQMLCRQVIRSAKHILQFIVNNF